MFDDRGRHDFGAFDRVRFLTGEGELAHSGAGGARIDDLDTQAAGVSGLVGIGTEQRIERGL